MPIERNCVPHTLSDQINQDWSVVLLAADGKGGITFVGSRRDDCPISFVHTDPSPSPTVEPGPDRVPSQVITVENIVATP